MKNYIEQIRNDGITTFMIKALKFILRKSIGFDWRRDIITERSLEEPIREIEPKIKVTIREATEDDLDKFKGIVTETKLELFSERFRKGSRICFIALYNKRIAYYSWVSFEDEYERNCQVKVKLNEKEAYWYDVYTVPEYRQKNLNTALTTKVLRYLKNKGYKRVLALVWSNNIYSRRAFRKVGFKGEKTVTFVKLFIFKFHIWRKFKRDL